MKAVFRNIESTSASVPDLESFVPDDPECFGVHTIATFGSDDGPGADIFYITVCTPLWLEDLVRSQGGILAGRNLLIVVRYDYQRVERFLRDYASKCEGDSWREVAEKLGRLGEWEFEDYQP